MNRLSKILESAMIVGQLGFSLVTPPLVLVWLSRLAQNRFGWGSWVTVAAILIGILTGFASAYRTLLPLLRKNSEKQPNDCSFNDHI